MLLFPVTIFKDSMVVYSINDIEKLSGVKAHTLRVWEKRYGIIQPKRTETNIRYYLDEDLKHVLNIALLNKKGIKISKIAKMPDQEIKTKVAQLSDVGTEFEDYLDSLTLSLLELNELKFNRILDSNIKQKGLERTMMEVIYPLLDKLGLMWITGSINGAHERFVRGHIRQKIIACTDKLESDPNKSTFIIYLPENEDQELSLLFAHFLIKKFGFTVINLGLHTPVKDISDAAHVAHPDFIYTIVNHNIAGMSMSEYVNSLKATIPDGKILLSGIQVAKCDPDPSGKINVLHSFQALSQYLEEISPIKKHAASFVAQL